MMRRLLLVAIAALALAGAAAWFARTALREPLSLPDSGYVLEVPAGASLRSVVLRLKEEGVLEHPRIVLAYGRLTGLAAGIKAGEYLVPAGTTPMALLRQLVEGKVRLHALTIVEGWTTHDLLRAVHRHPAIRASEPGQADAALLAAVAGGADHPEGWFFPDTYRFARGTTDREVLQMAYERMKTVLERAWAGRSAGLPLRSPYEALILASIVEKETGLDRERSRVAGVFVRRLQAGMRLQADPTVIYGLGGNFDGDLTRRQLAQDTPYNSYTRTGLPPSPIALPGESSLLAAVHPDESEALYFVASGEEDGSHVFSATLREHNAAVRRYLAMLKEDSK
ncbi:MAG: endolytic transglycosylase MltG [Gammaproteobacteria bacterium]|nr:endolytic transglycosylase MltG [Gammaproteobacteria bacterium]